MTSELISPLITVRFLSELHTVLQGSASVMLRYWLQACHFAKGGTFQHQAFLRSLSSCLTFSLHVSVFFSLWLFFYLTLPFCFFVFLSTHIHSHWAGNYLCGMWMFGTGHRGPRWRHWLFHPHLEVEKMILACAPFLCRQLLHCRASFDNSHLGNVFSDLAVCLSEKAISDLINVSVWELLRPVRASYHTTIDSVVL